ncbi:MAG TPA: hypothetical protein VE913_11715 [Longimicrobium sp.]|nr:hypothetical protein [Longimicrobium sp.]
MVRVALDELVRLEVPRSRHVVPHETSASESAVFDRPVTVSAPKSRGSQAYCEIAAEVIGRLGIESRAIGGGGAS